MTIDSIFEWVFELDPMTGFVVGVAGWFIVFFVVAVSQYSNVKKTFKR